MRRVAVTGLGAISPLGVGVGRAWRRLLAGDSGIVSVAGLEPQARWRELASAVAGLVPRDQWRAADWLGAAEQRRMATFAQYAVATADMALEHAGWKPARQADREATGVCLGSGIGNLHDMYSTSLAYEQDVRSRLRARVSRRRDRR